MAQALATKKAAGTGNAPKAKENKSAQALKGAYGSGLAGLLIREAEDAATQELRQETSYKDRLRELVKCTREDHLEFRAALAARRELISKEAEKAKLGVAKYLEANTVDRTLYNRISMWERMSKACETGWTPNYDKAWGEISRAASDRLAGQAAAAAQERTTKAIKEIGVRTDLTEEDKKALIHVEKMKMPVEAGGPTARTSARGRKRQDKPVWDTVLELIKDRPIHDAEKLTQQLLFYIATKMGNKGVRAVADSLIEDMTKNPVKAPSVVFEPAATGTGTAGSKAKAPKGEHATAKGSKRR